MTNISEISGIIFIIIFTTLCMIFLILSTIAAIQQKKDEDEYIKKLDDHEKAIILNYKRLSRLMPRKKKKYDK